MKDGRELFAILNARLRVLVLDHERRLRDVELQQFARGELMVEPVDRPILQVRQRIVTSRAGQLVLASTTCFFHALPIGRVGRRLAVLPVPRSIVWPP